MERFCKDCKWCYKGTERESVNWACLHPRNLTGRTDPVTGEKVPLLTHCSTHRQGPLGCGEAGVWWEAA